MRFISRNTRPPERRPHGLTLDDVRGLIRKPVSYWAIDESGNPSRKPKENGKPFTLSAVTELSPIDYDRLLEGVPLYDGEVHFSKLRNEHPDICISLMTNFGNESILILYKTVFKNAKYAVSGKIKGQPIDELYLLSLLNEIIEAILEVDSSEIVLITYDQNCSIREDSCVLLWNDRCMLTMGESKAYRLIQMADLSASSIGRSFLPGKFADYAYFEKIMGKSVNIKENRDIPQYRPALLQHDNRNFEYLTDSESTRNTENLQENGDRPQHNPTFLPRGCRGPKYLTDSEPAEKGSRISKNAKIGRRTETRGGPQPSPARLQHDAMDSGYLTRSEQKRPGLADCTQRSAFAPMGAGGLTQRPPSALGKRLDGSTQLPSSASWVSDSGSDYKEPHRCDPFGSKCGKKRCIQCN